MVLLAGCGRGDPTPEHQQPEYAARSYAVTDTGAARTTLRFSDITKSAGIDFVHETGAFGEKWMPETMGSGGGFLDYDGDGWPDIFLVNGSQWSGHDQGTVPATPRLYRNLGNGRFSDVTIQAGLDFTVYGMGAAFGDYDADGDLDIYVTALGRNKLLRNDGGRFTEVTGTAGGDGAGHAPAWSTGAAWVDVDRDGRLDLFVCNYVQWTPATDLFTTLDGKTKTYATPQQYQGESCRLYHNEDGRRFSDVTELAGVLNSDGKSLGVAIADVNDDGWPDLLVANDTERNFLYLNDGDGTFTDIALRAGIGYDEFGRARAGMGIDVGDVTGHGRLSIAIGNFSGESLALFTQIGNELFQDLAGSARLSRASLPALTFGLLFADFDLDGYLDLVTGNGHIEPTINTVQQNITFAQRPQLFLNDGWGRFVEVGDRLGEPFSVPIVARGIATADIDRDGDLDLLITVNGGSAKLLRNDLDMTDRRWVGIRLEGDRPNVNGIGAVVTVYVGELVQRRMVRTGSSYLTQSDVSMLIFGLGDALEADSLTVRWPTTGATHMFRSMRSGLTYLLRENEPGVLSADGR